MGCSPSVHCGCGRKGSVVRDEASRVRRSGFGRKQRQWQQHEPPCSMPSEPAGQGNGKLEETDMSQLLAESRSRREWSSRVLEGIPAEWRSRAESLAAAVAPFVPSRVSAAFASGLLAPTSRRGTPPSLLSDAQIVPQPMPRKVRAALLLVDVSGFTALSENARRQLGSEGVERFSLALSSFFAIMMSLIARYHGDVDCFAGDAVLVLFEPRADEVEAFSPSHATGGGAFGAAVRRALRCAQAIHARLDGFRYEPDDPPLSMHSALAAGEVMCVECGGEVAQRSEAFVIGSPLSDIADALSHSSKTEIAVAPSAARVLENGSAAGARHVSCWAQSLLPSGHLLLRPPCGADGIPILRSSISRRGPSRSSSLQDDYSLQIINTPSTFSTEGTHQFDAIVVRMHEIHNAESEYIQSLNSKPLAKRGGPRRTISRRALLQQVMRATTESAMSDQSDTSNSQEQDSMGLSTLLNFTPSCVRSSALAGHHSSILMEHRMVTTLFIIAGLKEHEQDFSNMAWLVSLQRVLGRSIDVVEAQMGGATRQITVDDKGLAMIFVFGLPGYQSSRQIMPCLLAARKILDLLDAAEIAATAGITVGTCFCGLVGDPRIRCEYAVMGDHVNTAARLAVAAAKRGECMLCSEAVYAATKNTQLAQHQLALESCGQLKMKGKEGEAQVFAPRAVSHDDFTAPQRQAVPVVGRCSELKELREVVAGGRDEPDDAAASVSFVMLRGQPGIGKSATVDTLMRESAQDEVLSEVRWFLLRGQVDDSVPFMACRSILCWLLEQSGEKDAENLSWLLGPFDEKGKALPPLLSRHESALHAVSSGTWDKTAQLQVLYSKILWDALQQERFVIVLEDVERLDRLSLLVLSALSWKVRLASTDEAEQATTSQRGTRGRHPPRSAIVCTSNKPELLSMDEGGAATAAKSYLSMTLEPLAPDAVMQIAHAALGPNLEQPIADLIVERSHGLPLHAVELCDWLVMEELVGEGRLSSKADGLDLQSLVPPSMQAMVQATVDQLPMVPGLVLRCASVLASSGAGKFSLPCLFHTLPQGLVQDMADLEQQLAVVQAANLIQKVVDIPTGSMLRDDLKWKICNSMHQEVVYNCMAHTHRRELHMKAANAMRKQLETVSGIARRRPLLKAVIWHLMQSCSEGGEGKMDSDDVLALTAALREAAETSHAMGDYEDSLSHRIMLLGILKSQNDLFDSPNGTLLNEESEALEAATSCVLTFASIYTDATEAHLGCPLKDKLLELSERQAEVQAALPGVNSDPSTTAKAAPLTVTSATIGGGGHAAAPRMPLRQRIAFTTKLTPIAFEFSNNKGFVKRASFQALLNEMKAHEAPVARTYISACTCQVSMNLATCRERMSVGEAAYSAFQQAGYPHTMNDVAGIPVTIPIIAFWYSGQVWAGELKAGAEGAFDSVAAAIDKVHLGYLFVYREAVEASWEPISSRRVRLARQQRVASGTPKKPWRGSAVCMDHLEKAYEDAEQLSPFLEGVVAERGGVAEGLQASVRDSLEAAFESSRETISVGNHFLEAVLSFSCIWLASRVIFPSHPTPDLSPLAIRHLASITSTLSKVVARWSKGGVNICRVQSFAPSSLMWARSSLHLFQLVLREAGLALEERPKAVHMLWGVHGYDDLLPPPDLAFGTGPAQVCSGLLMAQHIGADRGELLLGCLPATVMLARLLTADRCCGPLRRVLRGGRLSVPMDAPKCARDAHCERRRGGSTAEVECGSSAAREVARRHLQGVLQSVQLQGKRLRHEQVGGVEDVEGSESLWEAVRVLRELTTR